MNTMTEPSFGSRLTAAREAKGITKYRLAKLIGMSQAYVGQLEAGAYKPSDETVARLAPVLDVPMDEMQAWADADRLGEDRVKAVQAHAAQNDEMPQTPEEVEARLDYLVEQALKLPEEKRAKLAAYFFARARQLEEEGHGSLDGIDDPNLPPKRPKK